jgi:hypothetical protein
MMLACSPDFRFLALGNGLFEGEGRRVFPRIVLWTIPDWVRLK